MSPDALLYLTEEQVDNLLADIDPLQVVTDALQHTAAGTAGVGAEAALRWIAPDGTAARSLVLPARYAETYGYKVINACVGNLARGLPRAHGVVILHDPLTAAPSCVMAGAGISALRTAAVSLVALRAVRDLAAVRRVALLGCGRQARTHLDLFTAHCQRLTHATVYDIDPTRAHRFVEHHHKLLTRVVARVAATAEHAVRGADVTLAATTTTVPYAPLGWLRGGAVFLNVSLDDATVDLLLGCEHLFVDDWTLITQDNQRLLGRLARAGRVLGPDDTSEPTVGARKVDAELATLISGAYPRSIGRRDRIVINPFGMGVQDVAFAAHVLARARYTGTGTWLPR